MQADFGAPTGQSLLIKPKLFLLAFEKGYHTAMNKAPPFWIAKKLQDMTPDEWESLCDGCGRCCLHKLRDEDDESLHFTSVACRLLDLKTCQCTEYKTRRRKVPDCVTLTPDMLDDIDWLPPTCAYRLLADGSPLPQWHPLVSGRAESVAEAGVSASGRCISEREAVEFERYIVKWPGEDPTVGAQNGARGNQRNPNGRNRL